MVVRAVLFAVLFFFLGAAASWAICGFVLDLDQEIGLLVIEISAAVSAIAAGIYFRNKKPSQ
jgi:hypothetical protein